MPVFFLLRLGPPWATPFFSGGHGEPAREVSPQGLADVLTAARTLCGPTASPWAIIKEGTATHSIGDPGQMLTLRRESVIDVQPVQCPELKPWSSRNVCAKMAYCERSLARLKSGEIEMISAT